MATVSLAFYGGGVTARLEAGGWGAHFRVAAPRNHPAAALRLEVLWQPRDDAGWPDGAARIMHEDVATVYPGVDGRPGRALFVLPIRLAPAFLAECHYRLRAVESSAQFPARQAA
jgi:hypothetical protein